MILSYISALHTIKDLENSSVSYMEDNDCVVRAIASATNWDYDSTHAFVAKKFNRKFRKGTINFSDLMNKICYSNKRINRKKVKIIIPFEVDVDNRRLTIGSFVKKYRKGTYILLVRNHVFAIRDSTVISGNLEDSIKVKRILRGAWKIE